MPKKDHSQKKGASGVPLSDYVKARLVDGGLVFIVFVAAFVMLSLISFQSNLGAKAINAGGWVGGALAYSLMNVLGLVAYGFPVVLFMTVWSAIKMSRAQEIDWGVILTRIVGSVMAILGCCGLASLNGLAYHQLPASLGGVLGLFIAKHLYAAFNYIGAHILLLAMLTVGLSFIFEVHWMASIEKIGQLTVKAFAFIKKGLVKTLGYLIAIAQQGLSFPVKQLRASFRAYQTSKQSHHIPKVNIKRAKVSSSTVIKPPQPVSKAAKASLVEINDKPKENKLSERYQKEIQAPLFDSPTSNELPSLSLLALSKKGKTQGLSNQELEDVSRLVEQRLLDFGVDVQVVAVHPGPVITRFELQLAPGLKVSKITALAKDLARSLSVISVRVVEVIPGKSVIGIELPNEQREMVTFGEVLATEAYDKSKSPLTLALGVDIAGQPSIVDLAKMPHLLVAGTTGSGKSVGINAMILSLLFKSTPSEVRLILVDPKMLELSVYEGIPHLLTPVVTDMKDAASALRWSVGEMERRYRLMAALGVRNLAGFNKKVADAKALGEPLTDPLWKPTDSMDEAAPELLHLPCIVIVIDELADMMMVVGKKVEQLIARIAQKARAAGIHLILATQRPSVDVLTGLIKSNIPTRIAFQVSSKIDSRTILDQQGADQLLGHGDMLYLAPGTGAPIRVHGAFVDDDEVHRIASEWRKKGEPSYIDDVINSNIGEGGEFSLDGEETEDSDPLYDEAVEFVTQTRKASISSVQRRFKIGYNRAARLIEEMERTGVIGPMEGSSGREVLAPAPVEGA